MNSMNNPVDGIFISRVLRGFALVVAVFAFSLSARAQGVGSSRGLSSGDGNHTIQGRVHMPSGQSATGKTIKVILETTSSMGGSSTVADPDGSFRFNNLRPGRYTVVVDVGKEYEAPRETVDIDPGQMGDKQVNIQLRFKAGADPALANVPKDALDLYEKGTAAAQKGNPKSAAEFFGKAVAAYPQFSLALSDLGVQYLKLLQMDKAAETFEALLKLKPDDVAGQLNLGIALYNQSVALFGEKKLDESSQKAGQAETHLRAAIKLNSPGPSAHYYLGVTLIRLRQYDEAQKELELAISNGGDNLPQAHRYLGGLYQSVRRNKEAADELEKYLKLDPKAADAERIRGIIKDLRSKQ
jgi:Carboxypeptidase regulatory-like domain/Tetratricopeptide repeat